MSLGIRITPVLDEWNGAINEAVRKQIPFATALALTMTAKDAQKDMKSGLKDHVTVRGNERTGGWVGGSVRVKRATKQRLSSEVGTIGPALALLVTGGRRDENEAVPVSPSTRFSGGIPEGMKSGSAGRPRPKLKSKIGPRKYPSALLQRTDRATGTRTAFVATMKSGHTGVFERAGRPRAKVRGEGKTRRRLPIRLLYSFPGAIAVAPKVPWERTVIKTVQKRWAINAENALTKALASARPRR
jgi:hypothetical protein